MTDHAKESLSEHSDSPRLSDREALEAINQLRSNVVATQSAGWSNLMYPLVAILDAAGFEVDREPTDEQVADHFSTYGGAGGFPGHAIRPAGASARNQAANSRRKREQTRARMEGSSS